MMHVHGLTPECCFRLPKGGKFLRVFRSAPFSILNKNKHVPLNSELCIILHYSLCQMKNLQGAKQIPSSVLVMGYYTAPILIASALFVSMLAFLFIYFSCSSYWWNLKGLILLLHQQKCSSSSEIKTRDCCATMTKWQCLTAFPYVWQPNVPHVAFPPSGRHTDTKSAEHLKRRKKQRNKFLSPSLWHPSIRWHSWVWVIQFPTRQNLSQSPTRSSEGA